MIDCARRWTAASLIGVGRSIPRDKVVYRFVGGQRLPGIQLVCTVLQPSSRMGMWWCGEDHWPDESLVDRKSDGDRHHG